MHKNYYLFKAQVDWLKEKVIHGKIEECFTFQKSELIIKLFTNESQFLKISIDHSYPYIFLSKSRNIRESKLSFFDEILDQQISDIIIDSKDKIVNIILQKFKISAIFFGSKPNIILSDSHHNEISRFKQETLNALFQINKQKALPQEIDFKKIKYLLNENSGLNIIKFLSNAIAGYNYTLAREVCYNSNINFKTKINDISDAELNILIKKINDLQQKLNKVSPLIYYAEDIPKHLTITNLNYLDQTLNPVIFQSINTAWKSFIYQTIEYKEIQKLTKNSEDALNSRILFLKSSLKKLKQFEDLEKRKSESELKGNLLLTHINNIPKGTTFVELENIFEPDKRIIKIRLNPAKSVQENAQKYFTKFKNIDTQFEKLRNRKTKLQNELDSLTKIKTQYGFVNSLKQAKKLREVLIIKNILKSSKASELKNENLIHTFKNLLIDEKWNVYIGKNDINNDILTFKFANKYDLWFHAQGVPGSHTILKVHNKDDHIPMKIIKQVAAIAAYHSTAKHSGSVPVMYTQARYVRKTRKAKAGSVSVLQHKTVFVEPKDL